MEAPEVPLEETQDHIKEHARESSEKWILGVALSTAILAAFAAIGSLLAGQHINEAMIKQIRASDDWAYYQAKGIKAGVLDAKMELLGAAGKPASPADRAKVAQYASDQADISKHAKGLEAEAEEQLARHEKLAAAVTLFQIGIAVSAISVLTKRRFFWYVGLAFGVSGVAILIMAHLPVLKALL
jgi:hypothetical protein